MIILQTKNLLKLVYSNFNVNYFETFAKDMNGFMKIKACGTNDTIIFFVQ